MIICWLKVLLAIERLLTVRYWEHHTHLDWRSKHKRKQHRGFTYAIVFVLLAALISQHPNLLFKRYRSIQINYKRLMIIKTQNKNFFYGYHRFNSTLFTIISYLLLDTTVPIASVLVVNCFLLREIRKLPISLQIKVKESIGILFFLTFLSITMIPRALIGFYNYYSSNNNSIPLKNFIIFFYVCLGKLFYRLSFVDRMHISWKKMSTGLELINHAITGYACFLSSALLRSELKNMIWTKYIAHHLH